jgi:hypothetical protein
MRESAVGSAETIDPTVSEFVTGISLGECDWDPTAALKTQEKSALWLATYLLPRECD